MDKIMTPEEWIENRGLHNGKGYHNGIWRDLMKDYAAYVLSKQPKKDIILPEYAEYKTGGSPQFNLGLQEGINRTIDEVKRLNGL